MAFIGLFPLVIAMGFFAIFVICLIDAFLVMLQTIGFLLIYFGNKKNNIVKKIFGIILNLPFVYCFLYCQYHLTKDAFKIGTSFAYIFSYFYLLTALSIFFLSLFMLFAWLFISIYEKNFKIHKNKFIFWGICFATNVMLFLLLVIFFFL